MSLLSKPKLNRRWKKSLLVAVSLLLLVPSFAAAVLAMRFELAPVPQDPAQQQEKELKEKEKTDVINRRERTAVDLKERMARDPRFAEEIRRKQEVELEMRALKQAALIRLSRITMDQAIQIATSHMPGRVLSSVLDADRWEEPGKLAKDGTVFYHVILAEEANPETTIHVLINAVDGTILKSGKELPRKMRSPEND